MKRPLDRDRDAFGHALLDHLEGRGGVEFVERSDGHIEVSAAADVYFAEPTGLQADIMQRAIGRVLDLGCGAGRYSLYLQERGREVVAIDASPLAIDVCRRRGLRDARLLALEQVDSTLGRFDTILMLGNNLGLLRSVRTAKRILRKLYDVAKPAGRIIAETLDPYESNNPHHLAYHAQNRTKGRMGGQIGMRVRYKTYKTPWFDYLFVSRAELEAIVQDTGWSVSEILAADGASYIAILSRERVSIEPIKNVVDRV